MFSDPRGRAEHSPCPVTSRPVSSRGQLFYSATSFLQNDATQAAGCVTLKASVLLPTEAT